MQQFLALEKNDKVAVIILTGNEKGTSFCAGLNIAESFANLKQKSWWYDDFSHRTYGEIARIRKPIIAAISGHCFGVGFEFAMCADILLASENAKLCLPEINLGMNTSFGATRLTRALRKSNSMLKLLTGDTINAKEALHWRLVSQVLPT